jgi:hypothetical protein
MNPMRWFRRTFYCRRGIHRESDWIDTAAYRNVYCVDCGRHLIMRARKGPHGKLNPDLLPPNYRGPGLS